MLKWHFDREQYFCQQSVITEKILLPFITSRFPVSSNTKVVEIGCGEGGNLLPFLEKGCYVTGVDCSQIRIERAQKYYAQHPLKNNLTLIAKNIFDSNPSETGKFDLIILRDSLEHIANQDLLIPHLKEFLNPNGIFLICFPPWQMPFGGHQQICQNRFLSKIPYIHLLPEKIFIQLLKIFREKDYRIQELIDIRHTRLNIEKFKKLINQNKLTILRKELYLINPAYQFKFHLKPLKLPLFLNIPYLRNFYTSACYYLLSFEQP
jgi:SAM-dependent methyltransferase